MSISTNLLHRPHESTWQSVVLTKSPDHKREWSIATLEGQSALWMFENSLCDCFDDYQWKYLSHNASRLPPKIDIDLIIKYYGTKSILMYFLAQAIIPPKKERGKYDF